MENFCVFPPKNWNKFDCKGSSGGKRNSGRQERKASYKTLSQIPVEPVYTPESLEKVNYLEDVGLPGEFPYLRGVHPGGYRDRLWTMRMFAGFGLPEETNQRFRFLLDNGQTGLSTAFDMPTLYGYDTDDPRAAGEFGKCGVAVSSLADMETLFDGIPLGRVTTSMTINSPAAIIWAMYIVVAEKQGVPLEQIGGTLQNDILKEYLAQNEYIFPPEPSLRLVVDHRRVCHPVYASLEPDKHQWLPHKGSRLQRRAGTGFHPGRRFRVRPPVRGTGHGRGRLCAPPQFLLQRPQRFL